MATTPSPFCIVSRVNHKYKKNRRTFCQFFQVLTEVFLQSSNKLQLDTFSTRYTERVTNQKCRVALETIQRPELPGEWLRELHAHHKGKAQSTQHQAQISAKSPRPYQEPLGRYQIPD